MNFSDLFFIFQGSAAIMMNYVFAGLILFAAVWGVVTGHSDALASAILTGGSSAVTLILTVGGAMTLWSGIMAIAEKSGLTEYAAKLLRPLLGLLLPGMKKGGEAEKYVCMNVVSNLLGLGNAATPLGLKAMQAMRDEHGVLSGQASPDMMTFVVMNTASLQLLPTTLLTLRAEAGAADPMDIMPCVWVTSAAALTAGLLLCGALRGFTGIRSQKEGA